MYEKLKRKENETDYEFYERIGFMKLNKEIEKEWDELADIVGGFESGTHYRKKMYGIKEAKEYYEEKINNIKLDNVSQETLSEIDEKLLELKKEKIKLSDYKNYINRDIRRLSRVENIIDTMKDSVDTLNNNYPLMNSDMNQVKPENCNKSGLLLCSDWHLGACFSNMNNEYSLDIAIERVNIMVKRTIEIGKINNVGRLYIGAIGDLCNGLIRTVTRLENQIDVAEQVVMVSEVISKMLWELSNNFSTVTLIMTSSNHERFFQDKKENTESDSFHKFIREFIKLRTKNLTNVVILDNKLDESLSIIDICGETVLLSHGDKDRKNSCVSRYVQLLGYIPTVICLGHYHSEYSQVEGRSRVFVNGSLMGSNQYAVDLRLHAEPEQTLLLFSDKYGYESSYSIKLKDK